MGTSKRQLFKINRTSQMLWWCHCRQEHKLKGEVFFFFFKYVIDYHGNMDAENLTMGNIPIKGVSSLEGIKIHDGHRLYECLFVGQCVTMAASMEVQKTSKSRPRQRSMSTMDAELKAINRGLA